jgi:hypothetical protein
MVQINKSLEEATRLLLERREDGRLWATWNGASRPVRVHRCFPWSEPDQFLSLRDQENQEVAMVIRLDDLESQSRKALADSLLEAGFVLRITRILEVDEEVEIRTWKVETEQGSRSFQTKLDDWPWEVPGGGIVIRDVAGDLYYVADPESLDEKSRTWLWAFVD